METDDVFDFEDSSSEADDDPDLRRLRLADETDELIRMLEAEEQFYAAEGNDENYDDAQVSEEDDDSERDDSSSSEDSDEEVSL